MSKYTAVFHIGWMTVNASGDTLSDLVGEIEKAQDLHCLAQMASTMGTKKDKQEIKKLVAFIEKYNDEQLSIEDIQGLDVNLSVGALKCVSLTVNE